MFWECLLKMEKMKMLVLRRSKIIFRQSINDLFNRVNVLTSERSELIGAIDRNKEEIRRLNNENSAIKDFIKKKETLFVW